MRSRKALQAITTSTVVALGAAVTPVWAQNSPVSGNLSFSSSISTNTNPGLVTSPTGAVFDVSEKLAFSIRSENSTQFIAISGRTGVSFSSSASGGSSTTFDKPQGSLQYYRDGSNANLDLTAKVWSGDVISSFDNDPSSAINIIVDTGTLEQTSFGLVANWGLAGPINYSLSAKYDLDNYVGTTDPSLFDTSTSVLKAQATLRLSPTTQGSFSLTRTADAADDGFSSHSETADYAFSLNHQANATLTLKANLGYQVRSSTVSGATTASDGYLAGAGFVQALQTGTIFGDVSYDATRPVTSGFATVGRSIDFPLGTLRGSLTADWATGRATQVLGSANYSRQFSDGALDVNFSQSVSTDRLSRDVKYSTIGIAYQKALNSDTGIDLSLNLSRSEDGGRGSVATLNRTTLATSYTRALNSDWNMSLGYQHRSYSGSAATTTNSDSVFFTLTKNLQFGF